MVPKSKTIFFRFCALCYDIIVVGFYCTIFFVFFNIYWATGLQEYMIAKMTEKYTQNNADIQRRLPNICKLSLDWLPKNDLRFFLVKPSYQVTSKVSVFLRQLKITLNIFFVLFLQCILFLDTLLGHLSRAKKGVCILYTPQVVFFLNCIRARIAINLVGTGNFNPLK